MKAAIEEVIKKMERVMYGYNYEVCLGIDLFNGNTAADFEKAIKEKYPGTNPALYPLLPMEKESCLTDIAEKLNFRGDKYAGLVLKEEQEKKLALLQQQYFDYIYTFITDQTKFFDYIDPDGIPGYPVYWEYRYVLFTANNQIMLLYGSSSD